MEKSPLERTPEGSSEKNEKEREACLRVCEMAREIFEEAETKAKKERNFSPSDRRSSKRYSIENPADYMVAVSQRERMEGDRLLESVRENGQYYEEKAAGKLRTFLRKEEAFFRAFAELETRYPDLASFIKAQKPYLGDKIKDADLNWNK